MIYTSYFDNIKNLPKHIIPVSIAGKAPEWYHGFEYKKLAPKRWFFDEWKKNHDDDFYIRHYKEEVLDKLNWLDVYDEICDKLEASGIFHYDICLICYELPNEFCHRNLVRHWFNKNFIACEEWKND